MCESLNSKKNERVTSILAQTYSDADVICLQEVSAAWATSVASSALGHNYVALAPEKLDAKRDQNSIILLKRSIFDVSTASEITKLVAQQVDKSVSVSDGDLFAITVKGEVK